MPFQQTSLEFWVVALALFLAPSDGQISTGQLCISDCSTCPVICTAPPPPPVFESPPRSYIPQPPPPGFYGGYMSPSSNSLWGQPPPVPYYFAGARPSGQMPRTAGPGDYSYPYYYFYSSNSCCSSSSLSVFDVLFLCLFHFVF